MKKKKENWKAKQKSRAAKKTTKAKEEPPHKYFLIY